MPPLTAAGKRARELCHQFPQAPNRQLARMLYAEFTAHYRDIEAARDAIRYVRGVRGEKNRKCIANAEPWEPQLAGWKPQMPPSQADAWRPVTLPGVERVLSLSDVHAPFHDEAALAAAIQHGQKLRPDAVIINGDFGDHYAGSRFQKDPRLIDYTAELDCQAELLGYLRSKFRKAWILFKLGNHDERWDHFCWNKAPELSNEKQLQLHNRLNFEKFGIQRVDDNPIMAGKLPILHGHELAKGNSPVNPARGTFLKANHSVLIGHHHRTSTHSDPDMFGKETACWSQGCLCELTPRYARINKWNHGFAFIEVERDGDFNVHNYRISNEGKVRAA